MLNGRQTIATVDLNDNLTHGSSSPSRRTQVGMFGVPVDLGRASLRLD